MVEEVGYWLIWADDDVDSEVARLLTAGIEHQQAGRVAEAMDAYQAADGLAPDRYEARNNIAALLVQQGAIDRAITLLEACRQQAPEDLRVASNLMHVQVRGGDWAAAEATLAAIQDREGPQAWTEINRGTCWLAMLDPIRARRHFERALALDPAYEMAQEKIIYLADFDPATTPGEALALRRDWYERFGRPVAPVTVDHDNDPDPDRPLRVGYVSGDWHAHSALYCFGPVVRRHSPAVIPYAYSSTTHPPDPFTASLRQAVAEWREIAGMPDEEVADLIRRDRIDILVDLSGFTTNSRLLVFCRKPAPVQVTAWGYATGTGCLQIDAFFADAVVVRPDQYGAYSEQVITLPSVVPYEPPWVPPFDYAPAVGPLPAAATGRITFGSLNRAEKMHPGVAQVWAEILLGVPGSRLILKSHQLTMPPVQARVRGWFEACGIEAERVELSGTTPHAVHMGRLNEIDISLDPFPHSGGVSTLESLWMGVPVVTRIGPRSVERLSGSFLMQIGASRWVTETEADYVAIATELAQDIPALAEIRRTLRDRMQRAPMCQLDRYVAAVEGAYRRCWRRWISRQSVLTEAEVA